VDQSSTSLSFWGSGTKKPANPSPPTSARFFLAGKAYLKSNVPLKDLRKKNIIKQQQQAKLNSNNKKASEQTWKQTKTQTNNENTIKQTLEKQTNTDKQTNKKTNIKMIQTTKTNKQTNADKQTTNQTNKNKQINNQTKNVRGFKFQMPGLDLNLDRPVDSYHYKDVAKT